jgi:hypothetical protein
MSEFVYLYRNGETRASPEQMQAQMENWRSWMAGLQAKGHLKDPGHPLDRTGKLVKGNGTTVTDGPFAEAKDVIGGYTLIEAKDVSHAAELAAGCPIFNVGGHVEVRPVMKM